MNRLFVFATLLLLLSRATLGVDTPYGADTLPFHGGKASVVIIAKSVALLPQADTPIEGRPSVLLYRATELTYLVGDSASAVVFSVPSSLALSEPSQYVGKMLFLSAVTREADRADFPGIDGDVYRLIAGRLGAVDTRDERRVESVKKYLRTIRDEPVADGPKPALTAGREGWCDEHVGDDDPYLSRSAVFELQRFAHDDKSITILEKAVSMEKATPDLKQQIVTALSFSDSSRPLPILTKLAEDAKLSKSVRINAVRAVGKLPGGANELKKWTSHADALLKGASTLESQRLEKSLRKP